MTSAGGSTNPSWAWLGLLKWSLNYVDGTKPSDETMAPMSDEKRKFLEQVMSEGVIDPSKRMQELLGKLTDALYFLKQAALQETSAQIVPDTTAVAEDGKTSSTDESSTSEKVLNQDEMVEALEELRDIVEQIDYAQYFVKMNGLPFLLGCVTEQRGVPTVVRLECLKVLSTLAQNNPPVQQSLLDANKALDVLVGLYAAESENPQITDPNGTMRTMILQTLSCTIRGHTVGEESFCQSQICRAVIDNALGIQMMQTDATSSNSATTTTCMPPLKLARKAVFLLRALVTSDISSRQRVKDFTTALVRTIDFVEYDIVEDLELREASLSLLLQVLQQQNSVDGIMTQSTRLVGLAVKRVSQLRQLEASASSSNNDDDDDRELYTREKDLWEALLVELAKQPSDAAIDAQRAAAQAQESSTATSQPPLMLGGRPPDDPCTNLPQ